MAIVFNPLRTRIQAFIDRRFYRSRYDAARIIAAFNATLSAEIDLHQLRRRFLAVVQETMHPKLVLLWLHHTTPDIVDSANFAIAPGDPLLTYAQQHPKVLENMHLPLDSSALSALRAAGVKAIIPLVSQGELIGLLSLGVRRSGQKYARDDYALLNTLAVQVAPALHVAQMVQEQQQQVREHERIEQELRTAQFIQQSFLPREVPTLDGWQIATHYQPARQVGGDFYDFFPFEDGRLGIVIGDVAGKGMPAALVMAATCSMLRTVVQRTNSPGEVLQWINERLYTDTPSHMFATCFYAILDPCNGRLRFANAGHDLPYYRHDGQVSQLQATGMPLGWMPGTRYDEYEVTLAPGASLLLYSDGLVEAHNAQRAMFGFPRLMKLVGEHSGDPTLIDFLLHTLTTFTGDDWEQEDDVTLVAMWRHAQDHR